MTDPSQKDWAWRIVILHADGDNPTTLYGRKSRFDSIAEFLDWYSSWYDHLSLDQVRKQILSLYGDDDDEV
ncbi:uncharacterized protein N7498_005761 [Penicillium cinerascens]|uniref:Uncharacterized protein n=1 Tax=Penicillium cinerascens TaxID=70096 RepID=A0A9W9MP27_9EURO|nr:uncharacterized protein N7498_005761 [Penicillium cinerascens]KAJ5204882.1 hypothetical protein N7498_005761 [Penicillium cinerascens]